MNLRVVVNSYPYLRGRIHVFCVDLSLCLCSDTIFKTINFALNFVLEGTQGSRVPVIKYERLHGGCRGIPAFGMSRVNEAFRI